MEHLKPLTSGEENLIKVIWDSKAAYLKDIMQAYPEPKPHQNTISTFLKNLVEKNYLKTIQEGRIFRYEVTVPQKSYKMFLLKKFIQDFYNSNPNELLLDLMGEGLVQLSVNEKEAEKEKEKEKDKEKKKKKKKKK